MEKIEMEKIQKSYRKKYPILRIFKQDIKEIADIFKQNYEKIKIVADGYQLNDISEIDNIKKQEITDLEISCGGYSLESGYYTGLILSFSQDSAYISVYNDEDVKALGVASKIDTILSRRENKILNLLVSYWMFLVFNVIIWLVIWLFPSNENEILKPALLIFILLIVLFWMIWNWKVDTKKYSLIYLYDSKAPGFFKRNRDNIILVIISAVAGGIITNIISKTLN